MRHPLPESCRKADSGVQVLGITAFAGVARGSCITLTGKAAMPTLLRVPAMLLLLTVSCSSGQNSHPAPDPQRDEQARVRIENRASVDMDIYLLRADGQSMRLGFVAGGETSTFALPATLTSGATSITFEARPVRRSGQAVTSEPFPITRDEEISWSIPPQ